MIREKPLRFIVISCVMIFIVCVGYSSVVYADTINLVEGYGILADSHIKTTEASVVHNETGIHLSDLQCRRFVIQWDLSTNFTVGWNVSTAKMCFHMNEAKDATSEEFGIHEVFCDECYSEGNLTTDTWFSANMINASYEDTITLVNTLGWYCFDVPEMTENNMGDILTAAVYGTGESCGGDDYKVMGASEWAVTSLRPQNNITGTPPSSVDPLTVTLTNPINQTYQYSGSPVNISIDYTAISNETDAVTCYMINATGSNISIPSCANISMVVGEGYYNFYIYATKTNNEVNYSTVNFSVADTISPTLSIALPTNTTLVNTSLYYTTTDAFAIDDCWYSLNSGITNTTLTDCVNLTSIGQEGYNALLVYVNDTRGNLNFSSINFTLRFLLDNCTSSNATALNFTLYDEDGLNLTRGNMEITLYYWSPSNMSFISNVSFIFTNNTSFGICIFPNETITANATITYTADTYSQRSYYLINVNLTNSTRYVNLYLLKDSDGVVTNFYVENSYGTAQEEVVVKFERYYIGTNNYYTVAMIMTDEDGYGVTRLKPYDVLYRFTGERYGSYLDSWSPINIVPDPVTDEASITRVITGELLGEVYDYMNRVYAICSYNNVTTVLRCEVGDTSGIIQQSRFLVDRLGVVSWTNVYDDTQASSGHTFTYTVTNTTNNTYWYKVILYTDEGQITLVSEYLTFPTGALYYGTFGLFAAFILFLVLTFIGLPKPELALPLAVLSLVVSSLFGFIEVSIGSLIGLILIIGIAIHKYSGEG